jgi:hypothetical protein
MLYKLFLETPPALTTSIKGGSIWTVSAGYTVSKTTISDEELMSMICDKWQIHWRVTPLCNNRELYHNLKNISNTVWVPFGLMLGITRHESHIWTNFAPSYECSKSNNWAGIKWDYQRNKDWQEWCWLHKFETVEAFWYSFARSLKHGYIDKWCDTAECVARRRVRWDGKLDGKHNWINSVNQFAMTE